MKQIYRFKDWTSASKMKNQVDPCLKIDVGMILNNEDDTSKLRGYQITIIDSRIDRPVYRFYVDVGLPNSWTLTTREAIDVLNWIGFPCEFIFDSIKLTEEARQDLETLKAAGYTHVSRTVNPSHVYVYVSDGRGNYRKMFTVDQVLGRPYNYHDFWFVDETLMSIEGLLKLGSVSEESEEGDGE